MSIQMDKENITVESVMLLLDRIPVISPKTILKEALEAMDRFHLGISCLVGEQGELVGILTDGDIRRKLLSVQKPFPAFFAEDTISYAITKPTTVKPKDKLIDAVNLMDEKKIWDLPVIDNDGQLIGLLHLHPAVKALLTN